MVLRMLERRLAEDLDAPNAGTLLEDVKSSVGQYVMLAVADVETLHRTHEPGVSDQLKVSRLAALKAQLTTESFYNRLPDAERALIVEAIYGLPINTEAKDELLNVVDPQLSATKDVPQDATYAYMYVSKKRHTEWRKAGIDINNPMYLLGLIIDFFLKLTIRSPTQGTFKMMAAMLMMVTGNEKKQERGSGKSR